MSDHIVSVDAGNSVVNAVLARPGGKYRSVAFPSVRAAATGDSLGLADFEMQYFYVDWNGFRYVVGDDVTHVTRRHQSEPKSIPVTFRTFTLSDLINDAQNDCYADLTATLQFLLSQEKVS